MPYFINDKQLKISTRIKRIRRLQEITLSRKKLLILSLIATLLALIPTAIIFNPLNNLMWNAVNKLSNLWSNIIRCSLGVIGLLSITLFFIITHVNIVFHQKDKFHDRKSKIALMSFSIFLSILVGSSGFLIGYRFLQKFKPDSDVIKFLDDIANSFQYWNYVFVGLVILCLISFVVFAYRFYKAKCYVEEICNDLIKIRDGYNAYYRCLHDSLAGIKYQYESNNDHQDKLFLEKCIKMTKDLHLKTSHAITIYDTRVIKDCDTDVLLFQGHGEINLRNLLNFDRKKFEKCNSKAKLRVIARSLDFHLFNPNDNRLEDNKLENPKKLLKILNKTYEVFQFIKQQKLNNHENNLDAENHTNAGKIELTSLTNILNINAEIPSRANSI